MVTKRAERISSYWPQLNRLDGDNSPVYTACEFMDFHWTSSSVAEFRKLWRAGRTLPEIAEHFNRDPDEVMLLVIDQARRGRIKKWSAGSAGPTHAKKENAV